MVQLRSSDVQGFEKFVDLVRITVVKFHAEGRNGEHGEATLHSLQVKKPEPGGKVQSLVTRTEP